MGLLKSIYLKDRLYLVAAALVVLFVVGFFIPDWFQVALLCLVSLILLVTIDIVILYTNPQGVLASRQNLERLSNGDDNPVSLQLQNRYLFPVRLRVIDEIPIQFQMRDFDSRLTLGAGKSQEIQYSLRPVERGEYGFGAANVYAASPLGLISRRYRFSQDQAVPVYPSFLQMRKFELLAISNRLTEAGVKRIRKVGQNQEFEHIRKYVVGDDYRTINWRATARKNRLMVNQYQDEKSQQVYSMIDVGRVMKMPFEGLSLLDYAINSSLVISNIALHKQDKAGIMAFSDKLHLALPASGRSRQLEKIMQSLYNLKTQFLESDYARLYSVIKYRINKRSLLLLYTNFETLSALRRQLTYLRRINRDHVLVVIFFVNTELLKVIESEAKTTEEIYQKTVAEKLHYEKLQIVKELNKHGIYSVLTAPEDLSVNTINKYLELKSRGVL